MQNDFRIFLTAASLVLGGSRVLAGTPSLEKAGREIRGFSVASQAAPPPAPEAEAVPLLYYPVKPEVPHPDRNAADKFNGEAPFREALLNAEHSDWYFVPDAGPGGALLVVEKAYLDPAGLARVSGDLIQAVREIPAFLGRPPLSTKRFTVYLYGDGPSSYAPVPGAQPGESGAMVNFAREDRAPVFHEMTHMLFGYPPSQSLGEGLADYVQNHFRPGKAYGFVPANTDCRAAAKAAVETYSADFLKAIGSPGEYDEISGREEMRAFYYASWSFVDYLASIGSMKQLWTVVDAGGTPESYQKAYGQSFSRIKRGWLRRIGG